MIAAKSQERLPVLLYIVLGAMMFASSLNYELMGKNVTGWAWFFGLVVALGPLARYWTRISMPFVGWLPWFAMVVFYSFGKQSFALQSSVQILAPLIVGLAASCYRPDETELARVLNVLRWTALAFLLVILLFQVPMVLLGILPEVTGLAAPAITALIFQSVFLCAFLQQRRIIDLLLYVGCALLPVVAVTRGVLVASVGLVVMTEAPLAWLKRVAVVFLAIAGFVVAFHTERMQQKMFWSGHGTLWDLRWDNPDLKKSGRDTITALLWERFPEHPWLGHGANAFLDEFRTNSITLEQPHNDWLRILYCYGYVGLALFLSGMIYQYVQTRRALADALPINRALLLGCLTAFGPFLLIMSTDNVMIYAQFFGNLHFMLLGLGYGAVARQKEEAAQARSREEEAMADGAEYVDTGKGRRTARLRRLRWRRRAKREREAASSAAVFEPE